MDVSERLPSELLSGIPAILAAVELGSATQVAARLGTTTATVLRRIEAVEATLDVRLFERLPTGLEGTRALTTLLPWAEQIAAACDGIRRDMAGLDSTPSGHVRVTTPPTAASHLLVPRIHTLRRRYPNLTVELDTATSVVDLGQREADIALRGQRSSDGDLVQRKLGGYELIIACSPKLRKRFASRPEELPWLSWDRSQNHILEAIWLSSHFPQANIVLRASELNTLLRAAVAGVGAVLAPRLIADIEGGLVPFALDDVALPTGELWLVTHRALRQVPRVAAVWEWLESAFDAPTTAAL